MTKVQKWGSSLAIRIPAELAAQIDLTNGTEVSLVLRDGALEIRSAVEPKVSLRALLKSCKSSQIHREFYWGDGAGSEVTIS